MRIIINSRPTLKSGPVSKVACRVNSANIYRVRPTGMCLKSSCIRKDDAALA